MRSHEFAQLLEKYLKGTCTPEEEKLVEEWYGRIGAEKRAEPYNNIETRNRLWSKIRPQQVAETKRSSYFLKIAASIAFIIISGLGIFLTYEHAGNAGQWQAVQNSTRRIEKNMLSFRNDKNEPQTYPLSDGSVIILQPKGEIWFPETFNGTKREVHLKGEAFFNVRRDTSRPFLVYTGEVITKVLGTSFTIQAYDSVKQITVAVKTGKVSVQANPESKETALQEVILTPNQQVVYNRDARKVSVQLVEKPDIVLQEPTLFVMQYDGAPVTKIFEVLEENYGIPIRYDSELLKGCVLTTSMSDEGFYERIDVICKAINATYTVTDGVILIDSRGCN
jgi:transmembrane sensor